MRDIQQLDRGQRPGDIMLFCRPKGTSIFISWLTRSPYYHVAICADTLHVIELRPRGVICRDLRSNEGGHEFIVIPPPGEAGPRALNWAKSKLGDGYDDVGLAVIVLERIFAHLHINYRPSGDRFTCAEFIARAFEEVGAPLFSDLNSSEVIPADFARLIPESASRQLGMSRR